MSQENKNEKHRGFEIVMAVAIALPLLYLLSIGPAEVICMKHPNCCPVFHAFYLPVNWLHGQTVLRAPMEWYVEL